MDEKKKNNLGKEGRKYLITSRWDQLFQEMQKKRSIIVSIYRFI